jgi:serine/threonine protein kinase
MGFVYRARQRELDREVALKILRPPGDDEAAFADRFLREARALAKLSHPNIVDVYDFGRAGEHAWLLMELVDGASLRHLIATRSLSPRESLKVVEQICGALQFAHERGIVHRDIKPENVLVDREGRVKIADFGLAKLVAPDEAAAGTRLTRSYQAMGTPHYMAPEQIERPLDVDHRADIYSLGVVFYELLTGELPMGRFAPPSQKVEVDVRLDDVVLKALEKEPALRYQRASDVQTDLDGIAQEQARRPPVKVMPAAVERPEPPRKGGGGLAFGCLAVILVFLALALLTALFLGTARVGPHVVAPPPVPQEDAGGPPTSHPSPPRDR